MFTHSDKLLSTCIQFSFMMTLILFLAFWQRSGFMILLLLHLVSRLFRKKDLFWNSHKILRSFVLKRSFLSCNIQAHILWLFLQSLFSFVFLSFRFGYEILILSLLLFVSVLMIVSMRWKLQEAPVDLLD